MQKLIGQIGSSFRTLFKGSKSMQPPNTDHLSQQLQRLNINHPKPNEIDTVIYHGGCYDGFGAAFAAWKKLVLHDIILSIFSAYLVDRAPPLCICLLSIGIVCFLNIISTRISSKIIIPIVLPTFVLTINFSCVFRRFTFAIQSENDFSC